MAGEVDMEIVIPWDDPVEFPLFGKRFRISWSILLLIVGIIIVQVLLLQTLFVLFLDPPLVPFLLRGLAAEILTGRESGTAVFLEAEVPIWMTIQYSAMQDLATSFIIYPLYVFLLHKFQDRDNLIMRMVRRTRERALKHKHKVQRQGSIYLFIFMLIPFIINGPLIGLMIGRLVQIRMATLVTIVVAATVIPAAAWTLFYDTLFDITENFLPAAPSYITIGVLAIGALIVVTGSVAETLHDRKQQRAENARSPGNTAPSEPPENDR